MQETVILPPSQAYFTFFSDELNESVIARQPVLVSIVMAFRNAEPTTEGNKGVVQNYGS